MNHRTGGQVQDKVAKGKFLRKNKTNGMNRK